MKKTTLISTFLTTMFLVGCANTTPSSSVSNKTRFQSVSAKNITLVQSGENKNSCIICGMNLRMFYKTNHLATTKSGTKKQYCSIHCVVHDNEINKTNLVNLKVIDTNTLKPILAHKAFYVVGSNKPATMSRISKYAFASETQAKSFAKKFGGKIMKLDDVYTISMKDFKR